MRVMNGMLISAGFLISLILLQGCATSIKASTVQNPSPKEAFSAFGRIEIRPVKFKPGYSGDHAGLAKIEENLKKNLTPSLDAWNKRPNNNRTLVIEPIVDEMQFKHGAKRILLGPFAGSSGILMRLKIADSSGSVVATPEFFQRAGAFSAGFLMGVHDNLMLTRVATLASSYITANFDKAQGGPTGADDEAVSPR